MAKRYSQSSYSRKVSARKARSKKGSLEISITAVVVLIIAIVMLGLGLGFIRTFFGGTVAQLGEITQQLDEQTRTQLLSSPQRVTFLTSTITVEGRTKSVPFAIRNVRPNDIEFGITTRCFDAIGTEAVQESAEQWVQFQTFDTDTVVGGKSDVLPLQITMDAAAVPTIYKCEMVLEILNEYSPDGATISPDSDEPGYARKLFQLEYKK